VPLSRVDIAAFRNEPFTLPAQPEPRLPSFSDRTNLNSKGDQFNIDIKADIKTNQAAESIKKTINAAVQSYQGKKEIN
jgi:hypothetical protein